MKKKLLSMALAGALVGTSIVGISTRVYGVALNGVKSMTSINKIDDKVHKLNIKNFNSPYLSVDEINVKDGIKNKAENPQEVVNIPDENLKRGFRDILALAVDEDITAEEMSTLTRIDLIGFGIEDIEGLQYAINADTIVLDDNKIVDITLLSEMSKLTQLSLYSNEVNDIGVLKDMSQLTFLELGDNPLGDEDIKVLSNLLNLKTLGLSFLDISNLNVLENLKELENLKMFSCNLNDITPISNLTNLEQLYLPSNKITNIDSLESLKNLIILNLDDNNITSINVLKNLNVLLSVSMSNNKITDIDSLSNLDLLYLYLGGNEISDVSALSSMNNLNQLTLDNNRIYNISPLKNLNNIESFSAIEQQIVLPDGLVGKGTEVLIRDRNNNIPDITFLSPGEYQNNILTWSNPGVNVLLFNASDGLFTGTISQIVL